MFEPEWNVDINTEDTIMLGLREKSHKNQLTYLENKAKIKALLSEIGYEHVLTYMIEDLDRYDILGNKDLWVLRMAESLEDAYNILVGKYKDEDNIDSKVTPNEN